MSSKLRSIAIAVANTKIPPEEQNSIVDMARFYVDNTIDDPDAPADLDWLEYRGWIISKIAIVERTGATLRMSSIGPFARRINIDETGCSITSLAVADADRYLRNGITLADLPKAVSFSLPVCKGWPSRKLVLALEQLAKATV